jgi:hypothetical protein
MGENGLRSRLEYIGECISMGLVSEDDPHHVFTDLCYIAKGATAEIHKVMTILI